MVETGCLQEHTLFLIFFPGSKVQGVPKPEFLLYPSQSDLYNLQNSQKKLQAVAEIINFWQYSN